MIDLDCHLSTPQPACCAQILHAGRKIRFTGRECIIIEKPSIIWLFQEEKKRKKKLLIKGEYDCSSAWWAYEYQWKSHKIASCGRAPLAPRAEETLVVNNFFFPSQQSHKLRSVISREIKSLSAPCVVEIKEYYIGSRRTVMPHDYGGDWRQRCRRPAQTTAH